MHRAIALFSGGLDSQLAVKLMVDQGVEVECLTAVSVFHQGGPDVDENHPTAQAARRLGASITFINTSADLFDMVKNPRHGLGSRMNPCLDCRIFLLRKARDRMAEAGAEFVVTGEVLGQRPMSQRRHTMKQVVREAGLGGLVLRPLCAKRLSPTAPEERGWVDRDRLLGLTGRSRKPQMRLAEELGIADYPSPAGGCLLTDPGFAFRLRELLDHRDADVDDVALLRVGRHFRLDDRTKAIVARDEAECHELESLARDGDTLLQATEFTGPTTLLRGETSEDNLRTAARLTAAYGKGKAEPVVTVAVRRVGEDEAEQVAAPAADDDEVRDRMITRNKPAHSHEARSVMK
ncbi:MAG: hypothetical protein R6V58_13125 [Planctomycetota bacterium]